MLGIKKLLSSKQLESFPCAVFFQNPAFRVLGICMLLRMEDLLNNSSVSEGNIIAFTLV